MNLFYAKNCNVQFPYDSCILFLQINYSVVTSTEVAYFSYIYSVIPFEKYQRATGYLRSAMLTGYTFGASLSQMLVSLAGRTTKLCSESKIICKNI